MRLPKNAKEIPEFPGYYATSDGDIWSGANQRYFSYRKLKPHGTRLKYRHLTLCRGSKRFTCSVHRLILEAFVGPRPEGLECRHLDGNLQNNNLDNLCWGTKKDNQADRLKHGTAGRGEQNGRAKLNLLQVRTIKKLLTFNTLTQREIAKVFGVHFATVSCIARGKSWNKT